jgi:GGDEF domain-containing protein
LIQSGHFSWAPLASSPFGRSKTNELIIIVRGLDGRSGRGRGAAAQRGPGGRRGEPAALCGGSEAKVGFSVGVALLRPGRELSATDLIALADRAMYQVKHGAKRGVALHISGSSVASA